MSLKTGRTAGVRQAMVLAAGLGTRLKPFTHEKPKPLMEVMGQPLISYAFQHLESIGVEKAVLNTHHLPSLIVDEIQNAPPSFEVAFSHEPELLGTGGGIKKMADHLDLSAGPILILNADALIDLDVHGLVDTHRRNECISTVVLKDVPDAKSYGLIGTDVQMRVTDFAGRNTPQGPVQKQFMFCGVHLVEPSFFEWLPSSMEFCVNQIVYPRLLEAGERVFGFEHHSYFCDVGTPKRHLLANQELLSQRELLNHLDAFQGLKAMRPNIWVHHNAQIAPDVTMYAPVLIHEGARIASGVTVGPQAVIGKDVEIESGATIKSSVILKDSHIKKNAYCEQTIASVEHCLAVDA